MSADMTDYKPGKQVTFAAAPVTIPSTDLILAGIEGDTALSQAIVKGTIQVTDSNNPTLTKNVLVAVSSEPDHTYAKQPSKKKSNDSSSSSDDTSSSSESEGDVDKVMSSLASDSIHPLVFRSSKVFQHSDTKNISTNGLLETTPDTSASMPSVSDSSAQLTASRKRGRGCGNCPGCLRDDCGKCNYCLDKPKFGGPGRKKQKCALRICAHFKSASLPRNRAQAALLANSIQSPTTTVSQPMTSTPAKSVSALTPTTTTTIDTDTPVLLNVQSLLSSADASILSNTLTSSQGKSKQVEGCVSNNSNVSISVLEHLLKMQSAPETMKCVWCTRGRKLNAAYSKKFCSSRCFKNWSEIHPGQDPETAEPGSDNSFFIPTFDKDTPLALRKLQINMALPGSTHHHHQNSSATDLESPNDSPAPAKRPNDVSPGVPAKKTKGDTPKKNTPTTSSTASVVSLTPSIVDTPTPTTTEEKIDLNSVSVNLWSIADVRRYFEDTPDCQAVAPLLYDQEVDGQAMLLLSHDSLVKCVGIKLGPALKVMTHVERLRAQQSLVL